LSRRDLKQRWWEDIQGVKELNKEFDALLKAVSPEKAEPILLDAAEVIRDAARDNAPQGLTGNLKRGIVAKLLRPYQGNSIRSSMAGIDYRIAPHAHLVEFGTGPRTPKEKKVMYSNLTGIFYGTHAAPMPAHPFFRPAWDTQKERITNVIISKLKNNIESAWEQGASMAMPTVTTTDSEWESAWTEWTPGE
jgi:HK97 gp10 family phage protein